jgi:FkbM family methyltransferase
MRVVKLLAQVLESVSRILQGRDDPARMRLLGAYVRIKSKYLFARLLRLRIGTEQLFGFTVHFFSYSTFTFLFEEIFVSRDYCFPTDKHAPVILDCGSNIGMAILYYKSRHPNARVIGFEPDKPTFEKLRSNVEGNHLADVTIHNKALSDNDGTLTFYFDPDDPGMLLMSTREDRIGERGKTEVEATKPSHYIDGPIDFMKLDVEGAEDDVMTELVESGKLTLIDQMVIEYHHHLEMGVDKLSAMLALLEQNGYGYQLGAPCPVVFPTRRFQDILIYAYRKEGAGA